MPQRAEQNKVKAGKSRLSPEAIDKLYARLRAERPDARTELSYTNAFTLLMAVVMSAQMTDKGVNRATENLFTHIETPQDLLAMGEEKLARAIAGVNFHHTKAKNLIRLSQMLVDKHGGQVPRDRDALEELPGVGRKTANVILNEVYKEPTLAVDTHVFRVANRTGLAPGQTPLEVELILLDVTPEKYLVGAHHWLILHGRYVCLARKPLCGQCPVYEICLFPDKAMYRLKDAPQQVSVKKSAVQKTTTTAKSPVKSKARKPASKGST